MNQKQSKLKTGFLNLKELKTLRKTFDFYIASRYQAVTDWLCVWVDQTFLANFGGLYLTEFLTDFGQILDWNSYDQAQQTLWYHTTPRP